MSKETTDQHIEVLIDCGSQDQIRFFAEDYESNVMYQGEVQKSKLLSEVLNSLLLSSEDLSLAAEEMAYKSEQAVISSPEKEPDQETIDLCFAIQTEDWSDLPHLYECVFESGDSFLTAMRRFSEVETVPLPEMPCQRPYGYLIGAKG